MVIFQRRRKKTMFKQAEREKLKALIAMMGASGSGKTFSSLLLAKGMIQEMFPDLDDTSDEFWGKIGVIDTEHNRSKIYADMEKHGYYIGKFQHANIEPPFEPEKYIQAVREAKKHGIEVIIIDSTSHAWEYIRAWQQELGGRYQDWKDPDKLYNEFVKALTQTDIHILATMRAKQKYALEANEVGNLQVVKLGEQPQQRDTFEYEFLVGFMFDQNHNANVTKDNTPLFEELKQFRITPEHGKDLIKWLDKGVDVLAEKRAKEQAEQEEKEAVIRTIQSYTESNVAGMKEHAENAIEATEKKFGSLDTLPLKTLHTFVERMATKEKELISENEKLASEVSQELDKTQEQLNEEKTVAELKKVAKTFNIEGYSKMKKDELIAAIKEAQHAVQE